MRHFLGLPDADGRRIVPVTSATESHVEPNWDQSLKTMLQNQPAIVAARALVKQAEGDGSDEGRARLERVRASFKQVIHEKTHSLARTFLEIDSNYKQFQTASRLRSAAAQRLSAQRDYYEDGRITIDRLLDAVAQHGTCVSTEAQYKAVYNIALMGLREAQGTLLDYYTIDVAPGPKGIVGNAAKEGAAARPGPQGDPTPAPMQAVDAPAASCAPPPPVAGPFPPAPPPASGEEGEQTGLSATPLLPPAPQPSSGEPQAPATISKDGAPGRTFSFQLTLPLGSKPIEIRGSFTIGPAAANEASKGP